MSLPAVEKCFARGGNFFKTGRKKRDFLELAVGYGLILLVIWTSNPLQSLFYWTSILWIFLVTAVSFDGWKAMGLQLAGFRRSFWIVGIAFLLAAAAIIIAGALHVLHSPHGLFSFIRRFWGYIIWAFLQQFLLQDFFLLRLLRLLPGKNAAVIAAASLFAIAHLPNPILTPITLIWGLTACMLFLKYRNVYSLGLAHAIFGICIAICIPGQVDHNMRVGLGYLTYGPRHHRHLNHRDQIVSTDAWVIAEAPIRCS